MNRYMRAIIVIALVVFMSLILATCRGNAPPDVDAANPDITNGQTGECTNSGATETRTYRITFAVNWSATGSGRAVPGGAHLTTMKGATHNQEYTMWRVGGLATVGVETLAETGGSSPLSQEIQTQVGAGRADAEITIGGLGTMGSTMATFTAASTHPLISSVSMVAPTADWFVGLSSYCLLDSEGNWKNDVTIPLRIYDAGTEQDTNLFSLGNSPETPHKPISRFPGSDAAGFKESDNKHIIGSLRLECTGGC